MLRMARILVAVVLGFASTMAVAAEVEVANGRTVEVNGIQMYYQERGTGTPLVLLHGFGGCGQNWQPFADQLSAHHRLIIVDLRGHGHSTNPRKIFTHRQSARDVFSLLDALGIDRFSAMGMSSGGMTLLHMARSQPGRIQSMVLISATTRFTEQARSIMRQTSAETLPPEVQAIYRDCATRGDQQVRELVAQFHDFYKSYSDMNLTEADLAKISARTLIVHGDRDAFFPVEIPVTMYRAIPNAALWIVPNGDHVPIFDPAVAFTATALQFLDSPSISHRAEK